MIECSVFAQSLPRRHRAYRRTITRSARRLPSRASNSLDQRQSGRRAGALSCPLNLQLRPGRAPRLGMLRRVNRSCTCPPTSALDAAKVKATTRSQSGSLSSIGSIHPTGRAVLRPDKSNVLLQCAHTMRCAWQGWCRLTAFPPRRIGLPAQMQGLKSRLRGAGAVDVNRW